MIVPRTGGRGILRGKSGENGYRCSIEYLARGEPAKEGDAVVTSGLGGAFPRNLAVGHVTRVIPGAVGLYQDVEVTPDVDFARLSEVLVVVAPPPRARSRCRRPPPARPGRGLAVITDEIRWRRSTVALPAADPAVDGARAGARAHGGAQPRPAGRAARRAVVASGRSRRRRWSRSCTGYLFDLVSGAPQGVHAFVFVLMALFARALTTRGWRCSGIVLGAATSFVASLLAVGPGRASCAPRSAPEGGYGGLRQAPLEALLTGVVGPFVLWLLPPASTASVDTARSRVGLARGRAAARSGSMPSRIELTG